MHSRIKRLLHKPTRIISPLHCCLLLSYLQNQKDIIVNLFSGTTVENLETDSRKNPCLFLDNFNAITTAPGLCTLNEYKNEFQFSLNSCNKSQNLTISSSGSRVRHRHLDLHQVVQSMIASTRALPPSKRGTKTQTMAVQPSLPPIVPNASAYKHLTWTYGSSLIACNKL